MSQMSKLVNVALLVYIVVRVFWGPFVKSLMEVLS